MENFLMKNHKFQQKALSFFLLIVMIFGSIGVVSWFTEQVYAAGATATVRIIDGNNNEVITNSSISIESGVTTVGAVVAEACQAEGRSFELSSFNFPSTVGGITLESGYSWLSMINDSGSAFNSGNFTDITVSDGDRIVLYADSWPSVTTYSYFTVVTNGGVTVSPYEGTSYITGSVTLKLEQDVWGTVSPCKNTSIFITDESGNPLSTATYDYGLPPNFGDTASTSNSGTIKIDLYGNCNTANEGTFEKIFIVSSNASGIVKPYCKIVMTSNSMTFSQPIDSTGYRPTDPMVSHKADISTDVQTLIDGIKDVNDVHEPSYYDNDWALGMAAAGIVPTQAEKDKYLTWVLNTLANSGTSVATKAKTGIALTAFNIDARQIPNKNTGGTINLINTIAYSTPSGIDSTFTAPFMLSLYDLGNYTIPSDASVTRELLIDTIMAGKGLNYWGEYGTDGTGMVMSALAPYHNSSVPVNGISVASCSAITSTLNDAINYLSSKMGEYGGFPGWGDSLNSNTQAIVITGLTALKINPHTDAKFFNTASSMDNLLSYKTADAKLGYSDNTAENDSASKQGLWALATYQNLSGSRNSNLYHFTKEVATYTTWPDANLLTSIKVTAPNNTVYTYSSSETNYSPDTSGMVVTAIYNGNASNTTNVALGLCTVSKIDRSSAGTQTVTVSYQGCSANFMVTVKNSDGTVPAASTVSVKVKKNKNFIASSNSMVIEEGTTTAMDALKTVLNDARINYVISGGNYVSAIDGLGEFDLGKNSGWLYSVNGTTPPTTSANDYKLKNGDSVLWYYSLDYTQDSSSSSWTQPAKETASTVIAATVDSSGKATATMTKAELTNLLKEEKSALKIESSVATLTFDKAAMENILKETGGDIKISVAKVDQKLLSEETKQIVGDRPVYDFSVTGGNKSISSFGGKVKVSLPYTPSADENPEKIVIYHIDDKGNLKMIKDCKYDSKTKSIVFTTEHFSKYAVGYKSVNFDDVNGHWSLSNINYLASRGIINGKTGNSFKPNDNITRAEFVTILANNGGAVSSSKNAESDSSSKNTSPTALNPEFADVSANSWFSDSVSWAFANDLVKGSDSKFRPNDKITRQEMAVILDRYLANVEKSKASSTAKTTGFADESSIDAYAKSSVIKMKELGIINGKTAYNFAPKDYATRGETAKMITYMIQSSL